MGSSRRTRRTGCRCWRRQGHGPWVMLHRNNGLRRWKEGPCSVIQVSGTSCWIVNKTSLLKVSATNVRKASNDEKDGVELINRYLPTLREELLQRRRRREYWDLTHEQPLPAEEGDENVGPSRQESAAAESQESTEAPAATELEPSEAEAPSETPSEDAPRTSAKRPAELPIEYIDGDRARERSTARGSTDADAE